VSDTPRTDARRGFHGWYTAVDAEFSEKLEHELNAAQDRIKRLEELGDWMRHHSNNDWWCEKWDETKEAKP
jgi:hypothetical protein